MRSALVTGPRGFIGSHLVEFLLEQGVHVRCLLRNGSHPDTLPVSQVEIVTGDVCLPETLRSAVSGVDVVFHLAGRTSALDVQALMNTNSDGTGNLAQACAMQESPPRHIYVSSVAAAGPADPNQPRREEDSPNPISHYGRSKLAGEQQAAQWAADVPTTIIRPGIVFGERNRELLPMFYTIDRFRLHFHPRLRSFPLSVIYVGDLVQILWQLSEQGERIPANAERSSIGRYFACADTFPDYADWGRMIAEALDRLPLLVLPLVPPIPWFVGAISEALARTFRQSTSLNQDKIREANVDSWACSPAKLERQLEFKMTRPLREQLKTTSEWYRHVGWL